MDIICVDMDNTLIDSDKAHVLAYNLAFKKNGLKIFSSKEIKKYFGLSGLDILKCLFPKLNKEEILKLRDESHNFFINQTSQYLRAFNGTVKTLNELKKKYNLVLISNCNKKEILLSLKKTKIDHKLFKILVGLDSVKNPKPAADEIIYAEKKLNKKVKYVIGDSIYDLQAGKKADVKTIAVMTGNHNLNQLKKEKPEFILRNFNEVLKIL